MCNHPEVFGGLRLEATLQNFLIAGSFPTVGSEIWSIADIYCHRTPPPQTSLIEASKHLYVSLKTIELPHLTEVPPLLTSRLILFMWTLPYWADRPLRCCFRHTFIMCDSMIRFLPPGKAISTADEAPCCKRVAQNISTQKGLLTIAGIQLRISCPRHSKTPESLVQKISMG